MSKKTSKTTSIFKNTDNWIISEKINDEYKASCIKCRKVEEVCCDEGLDRSSEGVPMHYKPICINCCKHKEY